MISIVRQVEENPTYHLQVSDILRFEQQARAHPGRLGGDGALRLVEEVDRGPGRRQGARRRPELPRRSLAALQFLHLQRHILFHGHEPLDTDTTPTLEGEFWLMHNGFTQAEGVANLDGVPATAA